MAGSFFVVGGTMPQGSSSYLERRADKDLYQALSAGEFAFVLDSRQKGKSSLMARTRANLQSDGVQTALLDLQQFGSNVDPDRWYASMLYSLGDQLGMEDELLDLWDGLNAHGPMRRFFLAVERALSGKDHAPVVIFVDEVDFVRSLPFSADEFLAGIREVHNRKAIGELQGVTFCLLGVAAPWELIRDVRITPFNVGKRIELTDFTLAELAPYAAALSQGGRDGEALVKRIHHWTGGHPYLTQKLAAEVLSDDSVRNAGGVDRLVEKSFFTEKAKAEEQNLADVSRRVLESPIEGVSAEEARARVLDLYRQVRESKRTKDDDTDPAVTILKLSGLVGVLEGYLLVRNRIYFKAFDKSWVEANLPEAEAMRQKRAASRAAWRVGLVSGGIAACVGLLAVLAFAKAGEAERATQKAERLAASERISREEAQRFASSEQVAREKATDLARKEQLARKSALAKATEADRERAKAEAALRNVKLANEKTTKALLLAQAERAERGRADRKAAEAKRFSDTQTDLAAFRQYAFLLKKFDDALQSNPLLAIRFLNSASEYQNSKNSPEFEYRKMLISGERVRLEVPREQIFSVTFSAEGLILASAVSDGTVRFWSLETGKEMQKLKGFFPRLTHVAYSTDGSTLAGTSNSKFCEVWSAISGKKKLTIMSPVGDFNTVTFSPNGNLLVTGGTSGIAIVWDARTGKELIKLEGHFAPITSILYSPDGSIIATASRDETVRIWRAKTGEEINKIRLGELGDMLSLSFSPDGSKLAVAGKNYGVPLLDIKSGQLLKIVGQNRVMVKSVSFSPDGARLALVCSDGTVRIWNLDRDEEDAKIIGHSMPITSVAFRPNGFELATSSLDGSVRIWDLRKRGMAKRLSGHTDYVYAIQFSANGKLIVSGGGDHTARVWDAFTGRELHRFTLSGAIIRSIAISHDNTLLAAASDNGEFAVWNIGTGRQYKAQGLNSGIDRLKFSLDQRIIDVEYRDGRVERWRFIDGVKLRSTFKRVTPRSPGRSPNGSRLISLVGDSNSALWDSSGRVKEALLNLPFSFWRLAWSPDGKFIAFAIRDIEIVPLSVNAMKRLSPITEEEWIMSELERCAVSGNYQSWKWFTRRPAFINAVNAKRASAILDVASKSSNSLIRLEAANMLK